MSPQLIAINKPAQLQATEGPFATEHQAQWAERRSQESGLTGAFVRIGRRVFLDVPKFHELVSQQAVGNHGHR